VDHEDDPVLGRPVNLKKTIAIFFALFVAACATHEDLPPPLDVIDPPVPTNLQVQTEDLLTYDLAWTISDPSVVKEYRVYSSFAGQTPVLEGTTDQTSIQVVSPVAVEGISFCVSSVTIENVESRLICANPE
jgi:hypothetical protein